MYKELYYIYSMVSLYSFALYGLDKYRSTKGTHNRISERHLLLSEALGGWIGGILARRIFNHKTKKFNFLIKAVAIDVMHLGILAYILLGRG